MVALQRTIMYTSGYHHLKISSQYTSTCNRDYLFRMCSSSRCINMYKTATVMLTLDIAKEAVRHYQLAV